MDQTAKVAQVGDGKRVIIMRAVSGAGKTTLAKTYGFPVVSADNYFGDGYNFNPSLLGLAHRQCMQYFLKHVMRGESVVVDNTNTTAEEIAPYVAVGEALGFDVEVVQIDVDPEIAAKRNVHSVPVKSVHRMHERMQHAALPKWWKVTHVAATL